MLHTPSCIGAIHYKPCPLKRDTASPALVSRVVLILFLSLQKGSLRERAIQSTRTFTEKRKNTLHTASPSFVTFLSQSFSQLVSGCLGNKAQVQQFSHRWNVATIQSNSKHITDTALQNKPQKQLKPKSTSNSHNTM